MTKRTGWLSYLIIKTHIVLVDYSIYLIKSAKMFIVVQVI